MAATASAVQTNSVREDDFATFSQGELKSVALTSDGYLMPSYARRERGPAGAEIVWDALEEPAGSVLCATGHSGRLVRVIDAKTSRTVAQINDPELTAMLRLADGSVLVAAAPSGRIFKLAEKDALTTFTRLNANFVWRMIQDGDGNIWAATGSDGRLFRIRPGKSSPEVKEVHKFSSTNLLDLWIDKDGLMGKAGWIYVAGQNPGLLYRLDPAHPDQKPEVVYDSQAEEIRALQPLKDGLALALNTERAPSPLALQLATRIPGNPEAPPIGAPPRGDLVRAFSSSRERLGGPPRSQVVVLDAKGYQRELWTSPERPISDLAAAPGDGVLVAAGSQGRVYEVDLHGHSSIVVDLREDFVVRIRQIGDHYLLASARNGAAFTMDQERAGQAVFVSRAIDARVPVRWGRFYANGTIGNRQKCLVEFRLGNDGDTDSELWGDWSRQAEAQNGEAIAMPEGVARYAQYRLTLEQRGKDPLRVDWAELFFVEPNRPPRVNNVRVEPVNPPQAGPSASPGEQPQGTQAGTTGTRQSAQGKSVERQPRSNSMVYNVTWRAGDPNNDTLVYALYYRDRDEEAWKLVAEDLTQPRQMVSSSQMADGHYRFKVVASDKRDNAPGAALTGEFVSDEVAIDNTAPAIDKLRATVDGRVARIQFEASDATSNLVAAKYDLNNKDEASLQPVDGVLDQRHEQFEAQTAALEPGEYTATVNVTDREGNTSVAKVVFTIRK
ncbi:hypothetical protein LLG95_08915 [bacterium]|nr:hypothetical protein [bacterium]